MHLPSDKRFQDQQVQRPPEQFSLGYWHNVSFIDVLGEHNGGYLDCQGGRLNGNPRVRRMFGTTKYSKYTKKVIFRVFRVFRGSVRFLY